MGYYTKKPNYCTYHQLHAILLNFNPFFSQLAV